MRTVIALLSILVSLPLSGCGSDSDGFVTAYVVDVQADNTTLQVGDDGTIVRVSFAFDVSEVLDGNERVVVVILLPSSLVLRGDSAEVDGEIESNDKRVGAQTTSCGTNGTFLVFDLDRFDLDNAGNPGGIADARLDFIIDAVSENDFAEISARADGSTPIIECDRDLVYEAGTALLVLP